MVSIPTCLTQHKAKLKKLTTTRNIELSYDVILLLLIRLHVTID